MKVFGRSGLEISQKNSEFWFFCRFHLSLECILLDSLKLRILHYFQRMSPQLSRSNSQDFDEEVNLQNHPEKKGDFLH